MGRKVHPTGFRLGYIKDWDARWYATGKQYGELLQEDRMIREYIEANHSNAGISRIEIDRFPSQVQITLETARPGIIIGRKGATVRELRQLLEDKTGKKVKIEVEEVENADIVAKLVAENIAGQLERRISHSRAMKRAISQAMRQGAKGIRITASGRLGGSEMSRREVLNDGQVPLSTLRADIDYGTAEALTTYGRIGIKVWIYKGEVLGDDELQSEGVYVS